MRVQKVSYFLMLLVVLVGFTACGLTNGADEPETEPQVTPEPATPSETFDADFPPPIENIPTPTPEVIELKVWIPPEIAERTPEGAQALSRQLQAFDSENPNLTVNLQTKQARGDGGILNYLRTGRGIAPSVLPDVIVLPTELLSAAGNENLIFPLDDQLDAADLDPLYPAASQLSRQGENILGYPFALNSLPHLVYNSNVLGETLPLTWERLISNPERRLVMGGGGSDGALLTLQFYLDAGGNLEDEIGQPVLELEPLTAALNNLEEGRNSGFIVPQSSTVSSEDQAWQVFLGGGASIVRTSSNHFLGQVTTGLPIEYTVTPGVDRSLTPLVSGWAWAVSTADERRSELATDLVRHMVTEPNLTVWSQESDILPARQDALNAWTRDESYVQFIEQELDNAQALPVAESSKLLTVLGDAAFQVLAGTESAQSAASGAIAAFES